MPPPIIQACLLSLASNLRPSFYLTNVKKHLVTWGSCVVSDVLISTDNNTIISADSPPLSIEKYNYHNQMLIVYLHQPLRLTQMIEQTKLLEQKLDRHEYPKPRVTMDIDILAIAMLEVLIDNKDGLSTLITTQNHEQILYWYKINRRFPLQSYDKSLLENLFRQNKISSEFYQALL